MSGTMIVDDMFITIKKGAIFAIPNPKWDNDDPETHFNYEGRTTEDFVVFIGVGSGTHPIEIEEVQLIERVKL